MTPNAGRDRIDGLVSDEQGNELLRVAVNAIPEQGKANKALIRLLAKQWRLPKSRIKLVSGAKDRLKTLLVEQPEADLLQTLEQWAAPYR